MESLDLSFDLTRLQGKSAIITGGASGLGLATAQEWAAAGAYVTIADLQQPAAGTIIETSRVNYVHCDVTSWESQIAAFKSAIRFSPTQSLNIVALFAGTGVAPGNQVEHVLAAGPPSLHADPPEPSIRNIEVNLVGSYYSSWLGLYYLRIPSCSFSQSGNKSLLFCASIGAYMDSPKASTYPASKFGVRGLFRSTRAQTEQIGVRCNLLAPWFVDTPLIAPVKNAMAARGVDMAEALTFTSVESCVDAASYCAVNRDLHGRALAIQPEGTFDLNDDIQNGWAGDNLRPIMQRRRQDGFHA
ncbi:short chain dehydrogenase [Aspergillus sp. HF37]|nr:short chain dehydrogenase [Aspergillus sp. HF37]